MNRKPQTTARGHTTCPEMRELYDWLCDSLPDERSESISAHLDDCSSCNDIVCSYVDFDDEADSPGELLKELVDRAIDRLDDPGPVIGTYKLKSLIGRGGMGDVFLGESKILGRQAAVKVMNRTHAAKASSKRRFRSEIAALGRLKHDHIALAYDADEYQDSFYLAMEYIDGPNIEQVCRARGDRLGLAEACEVGCQAIKGIRYLHQEGIIHRDIKPANLLLSRQGRIHLTDFGLARIRHTAPADSLQVVSVAGTPSYMAPEQYTGRGVDESCDIYGLGRTLTRLLWGSEALDDELLESPVDVPDEIRGLIHAMTKHEKTDRPRDLQSIQSILRRYAGQVELAKLAELVPSESFLQPISESSLASQQATTGRPVSTHRAEGSQPTTASRLFQPASVTAAMVLVVLIGVVAWMTQWGKYGDPKQSRSAAGIALNDPGVHTLLNTEPRTLVADSSATVHFHASQQRLHLSSQTLCAVAIAETKSNAYSFVVDIDPVSFDGVGLFFGAQQGRWKDEPVWFMQTLRLQKRLGPLEPGQPDYLLVRGYEGVSLESGTSVVKHSSTSAPIRLDLVEPLQLKLTVENGHLISVRASGTALSNLCDARLEAALAAQPLRDAEPKATGAMGCLTVQAGATFFDASLRIDER